MKTRFWFVIYKPSGKHKKFRIIKVYKAAGQVSQTLELPEVDTINYDYISGKINLTDATLLMKKVRRNLQIDSGQRPTEPIFNSINRRALNRYWESEYVPRLVRIIDKKSPRWELERSVDAIGNVSLEAASRQELQAAVDKAVSGNKHRRVVSRINSILKFLKRDFRLVAARKVRPEVKYLTFGELQKLLSSISDRHLCIMHTVAYRTGCRVGELFALKPHHYNKQTSTIKVYTQIDRNGVERETKNRQRRTAYVLPHSEEMLDEWFKIRRKISLAQRRSISKITQRYTRQLFPKDPSKWITFHDLRHSYAIHLIGMGVPLNLVAQSIGDTVQVAEEYYIGFDLSSTSIDMINHLVKRSKESEE